MTLLQTLFQHYCWNQELTSCTTAMFLSTHENQHEAESIPVQKSSYFKTVLNPVIYSLSQQQFIIVYVQAWGFKKKKKDNEQSKWGPVVSIHWLW